ncbi:MAG: MBOAT family protein [Clostridia bacterium]|nr:MBOAT family protein [Clostridia bacterium]
MVFSSTVFLFYFLPIVLFIYYIVPKKFKNIVLLIFSIIFYAYGEPKFIFIMIFSIVFTYIFGILINKYKNTKYSKIILIISICFNLGILIYFKYIDFIIENINLWLSSKIDLLYVLLPIGISFYTFQTISYLIDLYRGKVEVQKNFLNLALYVSLFPQLIAGPIVRYKDIKEQLEYRSHTIEKFAFGIRRFIIGLSKKVLIANLLGELVNIFMISNEKSVIFFWIYAISNMLQIYFDFSGYSDMAIGLGNMFGFEFPENFNYPYSATSITDFWRRWHISLSSWFRDYVYIPLGGNKSKNIRNILIVWILTGLWHGAEWNFIIWGVYFGILLIIEKKFLFKYIEKFPKVLRIIYTDFIVMMSFIIFSGTDVNQILENIKGLFGIGNISFKSNESIYYLKSYFVIIVIGIIASTTILKKVINKFKFQKFINLLEPIVLMILFIVSTSYIIDGSFNPFLYFRF